MSELSKEELALEIGLVPRWKKKLVGAFGNGATAQSVGMDPNVPPRHM
jgi:hypothetical protein